MSNDLTRPGNYKAYNILHKIRTWKLRGQDPSFLFEGVDLDYRELAETDWLDFQSQVRRVWDNELKKLPNPREQEALGYDVYRNESMGALEVLGKLLSLRSIFAQFVRLSRQYSLVEDYSVHNLRRNSVVLIYTPKKEFYEFFGLENPSFAKGFLRAMPKIYELSYAKEGERIPDARVEIVMNWVSLETALLKNYAYLTTGMDIEIAGDGLYVDKKLLAKKIFLAVEEETVTPLTRMVDFLIGKGKTKQRLLYTGKEGKRLVTIDNPLGKDGTGYLVLEDLVIDDTLVLGKGEVFDAPYCRFDISWSNIPYRMRVKYALRDLSTAMRSSRQKLLEQLEIADERYFNEIKARQRAERAEQEVKAANEKLRIAHKKLQDYAEHLEDLVEERTAQLVEAEKLAAVGRLSFGVGHDLRNTLATAINSGIPLRRLVADLQCVVDMLKEGEPTEEIATYLSRRKISSRMSNAPRLYETMMGSLAQALDNVKALEGYAVQDGSDLQDVRIEDVIGRVLQDYQEELQSILVETSFERREYAFQGNPLKLYDVVQNLVINAIEALGESADPVLRITTQIDKDVHRTTVEDNGHGMSEEVRRHAFEPFYTTKGLAQGRQRGLGLFNVWRLVQQHSGTIEIQSEPGQCTRFQVCFKVGKQATD